MLMRARASARPRCDRFAQESLDHLRHHRRGVRALGVRTRGCALARDPLRVLDVAHEQRPQRSGKFSGEAIPPISVVIMSETPSAPVDRQGREASMPRITARGAPSVGLGQNTDTSNADSTSGISPPGVAMKCARSPSGAASAAAASRSLRPGEDQVHARIVQFPHRADDDVVALLSVKARDAAHHEGLRGDPQLLAHPPRPCSVYRISSVRITFGTTTSFPCHTHLGDRAARALRDGHHQRRPRAAAR